MSTLAGVATIGHRPAGEGLAHVPPVPGPATALREESITGNVHLRGRVPVPQPADPLTTAAFHAPIGIDDLGVVCQNMSREDLCDGVAEWRCERAAAATPPPTDVDEAAGEVGAASMAFRPSL